MRLLWRRRTNNVSEILVKRVLRISPEDVLILAFVTGVPAAIDRKVYINDEDVHLAVLKWHTT